MIFSKISTSRPHPRPISQNIWGWDPGINEFNVQVIPMFNQVENLCFRLLDSIQFNSVQFSRSFMSDSLQPHGLQHTRPPCPSPTPGAYSDSCPLHQCCHPIISSSVVPFTSHLQSFPASGSFPMNPFFTSGGQSTRVSLSTSVLPMNIQNWFPLRLTTSLLWWDV